MRGGSNAGCAVGVSVRGTAALPVAGVWVRVGGCELARGERNDIPSGVSTRLAVGPVPRASVLRGTPRSSLIGCIPLGVRRVWFGFVIVRACEIGGADVFFGRFEGTGFAATSHAPYAASA